MDSVMEFDVGLEEPEKVAVNCSQVLLLTSFDRSRLLPYRMTRKLTRLEVLHVGKEGKKTVEQLLQELLNKTPSQVPRATTPSASRTGESQPSKGKKLIRGKITSDSKNSSQLEKPCPHCHCKRFRVVNTGRLDGRNVMECTNRSCLATIKLTTLPDGMLINPCNELERSTWYDFEAEELFYPSATTLKRLQESLKVNSSKPFIPKIRHDEQGSIIIRCPGQKEYVKLL
ncbi:hypothetical protein Q1695_012382 [Nippostrongylus brasiliensis]|nr:hypothetical protein Q1695_012382 [Nippostrongylus brasiliensis]